jgi:hypothetical protein
MRPLFKVDHTMDYIFIMFVSFLNKEN